MQRFATSLHLVLMYLHNGLQNEALTEMQRGLCEECVRRGMNQNRWFNKNQLFISLKNTKSNAVQAQCE